MDLKTGTVLWSAECHYMLIDYSSNFIDVSEVFEREQNNVNGDSVISIGSS